MQLERITLVVVLVRCWKEAVGVTIGKPVRWFMVPGGEMTKALMAVITMRKERLGVKYLESIHLGG